MAVEHQPEPMSVEEYFELEKNSSGICYEYIDGYVYMMAGGTLNHDTIKSNIQGMLWNFLRGKRCHAYSSDAKVPINAKKYFHPDITVSCSPSDRGTIDVIKSPRIIFEVLSPGTELNDRNLKMKLYLSLPTLEEYIMVNSQMIEMEMFRKEDGKWVYYTFGPDDELELKGISFRFPIAEAYLDVKFENGPTSKTRSE